MNKTIHCLVAPKFWPLRDEPSQEHCINVAYYLLTKHCKNSGSFFDNKYETIQPPDKVDRNEIFRLSYKKRLAQLVIDSSVSTSNIGVVESVDVIRGFFDSLYSLTDEQSYKLRNYIRSDSFLRDTSRWIDNMDLKRTGYSYNYQKNNSVNTKFRGNKKDMYSGSNDLFFSEDVTKLANELVTAVGKSSLTEFREIFYKFSTLYKMLTESEKPYVNQINFWSIDGVSSSYDVKDHQSIAPIKDSDTMIGRIGQIYQARRTWVIPFEVEYY